jgi:hypothetical protein
MSIVCPIERGSLTSNHVIGCAYSPFGSFNPGVAKHARFTRPRWRPNREFIFLASHVRLNAARLLGALHLLVSGGTLQRCDFQVKRRTLCSIACRRALV